MEELRRDVAARRPRLLVATPSNAACDELLSRVMTDRFCDGNGAPARAFLPVFILLCFYQVVSCSAVSVPGWEERSTLVVGWGEGWLAPLEAAGLRGGGAAGGGHGPGRTRRHQPPPSGAGGRYAPNVVRVGASAGELVAPAVRERFVGQLVARYRSLAPPQWAARRAVCACVRACVRARTSVFVGKSF